MSFGRDQLLYFVTVVEEGQMTRAAAKLHIAQPALSHSIAQLEREAGLKLLDRHARGVTLTPDGEAFYEKARAAVAAVAEVAETARSLARAQVRLVELGFVGAAPGIHSPDLLRQFAEEHPDIEFRYRELPFPSAPTRSWLAEVDIAVCHLPEADQAVWSQRLFHEPRSVVASAGHPLAGCSELRFEEVLDETFIGFHPSVEPNWAGFWSLDDHRGAPPRRSTVDRAANVAEVLASLAMCTAISTMPASVAAAVTSEVSGLVAIPVMDARHCEVMLLGRVDHRSAAVESVLSFMPVPEGGPQHRLDAAVSSAKQP